MAPCRPDLQALADICSDWFEAADIHANPAKSVHLSYDPVTNRPTAGGPIMLGTENRRASVNRLQPLKEPLRVLGMFVVPDGSHAPILNMVKNLAASQAALLRSRALTDKIALFLLRAVQMPALTYKMQGHGFTANETRDIHRPIMQALKHKMGLPTTFPSAILHHRLAGKVPRLETVHTANNLTLQLRAMNASTPLAEIALAREAVTEHALKHPGRMLEAPYHVQQLGANRMKRGRRLFVPSVASNLLSRGAQIGVPTYAPQWADAHSIPTSPPLLIDIYKQPLSRAELTTAYKRAIILVSDVFRIQRARVLMQPQSSGRHPALIHSMRQWSDNMPYGDQLLMKRALNTARAYPPDASLVIPFTREEVRRIYGQRHAAATDPAAEWVAYTDGSVISADGRAKGSFAGTFTQGPSNPINFQGRTIEPPMSSMKVEAMAIAVAIIIAPSDAPLTIYSDSQAAVNMMKHIEAPTVTKELAKSPEAFLWLHIRRWTRDRVAPVTVKWVQGHSGVEGNERADRLAASAHDDTAVMRWTTRMPPPSDTPYWLLYKGRVIPRRARRLIREQDEAITANQLVKQVNAVPNRPTQSAQDVKNILRALQWTTLPSGEIKKRKCWNITNNQDSCKRSYGYKLLFFFLATLFREWSWYPWVYDRPELRRCAKCGEQQETQEHIFACADHAAAEECFRAKYLMIQPKEEERIDVDTIQPWNWLGCLQGRVDPRWKTVIPMLQHGRGRVESTASVIQQLLRAALETAYHAIWLPRCQRTIEQERSQGLSQSTKLRRMRIGRQHSMDAPESPTPNFPPSFLKTPTDRREAHHLFMDHLMCGPI